MPLSTQHAGTLDWSAVANIADAARYVVKRTGRNGWLGALSAHGESAAALLARSRRPLAEWAQSGEIELLWSPGHGGMATAGIGNAAPLAPPRKAPGVC